MEFTRHKIICCMLVGVILVFSLAYLAAINHYWKITPDSTDYVLGGQSLAAGRGYTIGGAPISVLLPGTSVVFSLALLAFPGSYLALNAVVTILALASMALAFLFFRRETHLSNGLLLVSLCIGSTVLFYHSRFLLSDVVYLFFSLAVLVAIPTVPNADTGWKRQCFIGLLLLAACMTRIVGVALVAAIFLSNVFDRLSHRTNRFQVAIPVLAAVLGVVAFWDYRSLETGHSYFKVFLQREPWVDESGYMSAAELATKFLESFERFRHIGAIFENKMLQSHGMFENAVFALAVSAVLLGLVISLKKRPSAAAIYTIIHLWLIGTFQADEGNRYFVPLLPFLFLHGFLAFQFTKSTVARFSGSLLPALISATGVAYAAVYLTLGLISMIRSIPAEHRSPFGVYPIKYSSNYDAQRLALWLRDNSSADQTYVSQHAIMFDLMTQRKGYQFPLTTNPQELLDLLAAKRIRYILVDKKKPVQQKYLLPVILAHPAKFKLIRDEKTASLYQYQLL